MYHPSMFPLSKLIARLLFFVAAGFLLLQCSSSKTITSTTAAAAPPGDTAPIFPQYRGENRDGIVATTSPIPAWPSSGPSLLWKHPIGPGFSGIVSDHHHFYTTFVADSTEFIGAFQISDGINIWRTPIDSVFVNSEFGDGTRSTPVLHGPHVFILSGSGTLHALLRASGAPIWAVDFTERFEARIPRFGYSMTPLIDGNQLVIETSGLIKVDETEKTFVNHLAAFDINSGSLLWEYRIDGGTAGYSSPIMAMLNGRKCYIFITSGNVMALSTSGELLWQHKSLPGVIAMPIFVAPDKLFVSSSQDDGCVMLQITADADSARVEELWQNRSMRNHFNSSAYYNGHIYGFSSATLTCVDAVTGKRKWAKRGLGKGSVLIAGDQLLALGDRGELVLAETTPDQYVELARFQALNGKSWTAPTYQDGRLLLRNLGEIACYQLTEPVTH